MTIDSPAPAARITPEFVITRRFEAGIARVWDAWTRPDQLARWYGPKGTTTTVLAFDLRPGGMLHTRMETPGGAMWARFIYREIDPPHRLAWAQGFADADANLAPSPFGGPWPPELLTTVVFAAEGDATRITLTWAPLDATPEEEDAFAALMSSMTQGWTGSLDQLEELLSEG